MLFRTVNASKGSIYYNRIRINIKVVCIWVIYDKWPLIYRLPFFFLQESKIYGSHFKEITADAPKPTKITFGDSDED